MKWESRAETATRTIVEKQVTSSAQQITMSVYRVGKFLICFLKRPLSFVVCFRIVRKAGLLATSSFYPHFAEDLQGFVG